MVVGIFMLHSAKAKALPCGRASALEQYVVLMHAVLTQQDKHHVAFSFSELCDPTAITEVTVFVGSSCTVSSTPNCPGRQIKLD